MKMPAPARLTAIAVAALVMAAAPRLARADAQQQQSFSVWNQMNDCARLAAKQYPDHTPEGNAKREVARQNCLRQRHLPVVPAAPPAGSGQ
jgi:ABC-type sugar transport system substrate-binding protein